MFMTPIPPTSSDRIATPISRMFSVSLTVLAVDSRESCVAMVKSAALVVVTECRASRIASISW
jgi:hypothetical protein